MERLADYLSTSARRVKPGKTRVAVMHPEAAEALRERFRWDNKKTQNPPDFSSVIGRDERLAMFAGFFDGDGSVSITGNTVSLRIQCHKSWLRVLKEMAEWVSVVVPEEIQPNVGLTKPRKSDGATYALWSTARRVAVRGIYEEVMKLDLPVLGRKWGKMVLTDKGGNR